MLVLWGVPVFGLDFKNCDFSPDTNLSGPGDKVLVYTTMDLTSVWSTTQPFATTSGTSGCGKNKGTVEKAAFIHYTGDALAMDMARGGGERLKALAALMGLTESQYPAFAALTQHRFETLYTAEPINGFKVLERLEAQMREAAIH